MKLNVPKLSIITPSFNQAEFLEETIKSVISQGYPNLEYIIIDGGSTDGSVEIIKQYDKYINYWISEADRGQAHAINKGLSMATGEWVGWQNSDDIYYEGCFDNLSNYFFNDDIDLIVGNINIINKKGQVLRDLKYVTPTYESLLAEGMIVANQAAFWRKNKKLMNEEYHYNFDYDWFLEILKKSNALHINKTWGALRYHDGSKTSTNPEMFTIENTKILHDHGVRKKYKTYYILRRAILTLINGELFYLVRGIRNRIFK
jgi:glycosyltransferase involved in cell wall biosynthesis